MANLVTTIYEAVTINGSQRGTVNTLTTADITDIFERVVSCAHSQETTVALFETTPHTSPGAIDVENVAYCRLSNLSSTDAIYLAVVGASTNYTVKIRPGGAHVLYNGEDVLIAETDTSPGFTGYEDLKKLTVKPAGVTDCQIEVFVGLT